MRRFLTAVTAALAICAAVDMQNNALRAAEPQSDSHTKSEIIEIAEIAAMPAGSWLPYGRPWRDLDLGRDDNCGRRLGAILGAWNGVLWDGRYVWNWAGGGHGDGCFNGIVRYDLEAGRAEVIVPHLPLNVPLMRVFRYEADGVTPADGWFEPYASDTPAPVGLDSTKRQRFAAGVWIERDDFRSTRHGNYLRPRASHIYNNMVRIGDWIYLPTGGIFGSGKSDWQVWRFNVSDPANTIERLPDRWDPAGRGGRGDGIGGIAVNWIERPGQPALMVSGSTYCEPDMVAGEYNCTSGPGFSGTLNAVWDQSRGGFWALDTQRELLAFVQPDGSGNWASRTIVKDPVLKNNLIGYAGICIVPTDSGTNPVILGKDARLLRWDGEALSVVAGQTGQPVTTAGSILNKWRWNETLGVCLGIWDWDEGLWAWRPDFSSRQASETLTPPQTSGPNGEMPVTLPASGPGSDAPVSSPTPRRSAGVPEVQFSTFAGHLAAPLPVYVEAWDEPTQLEPEAPDMAALCPGNWVERNYTSDSDLSGAQVENRNIANVRVYLHARPDGTAYTARLKFDRVNCAEVIGVPDAEGNKPIIRGQNIVSPWVGIVVREVVLDEAQVTYNGNKAQNRYIKFIALHGVRMIQQGPLYGTASPVAAPTYIEMRGNVFGPNQGWHLFYLERSSGPLVARGNVFYGPGRGYHTFKNLAHQSIIEGNLFSNAGVDGQPTGVDARGDPLVGLFSLDLYPCNDVVFRGNTVVHRTDNFVRTYLGSRSRNAWGGCNRGRRLPDGTREVFQPGSPEYNDPAVWDEIGEAIDRAGTNYASWLAEDWLTTYLVEDNTFVLVRRNPEDTAALITFSSQRPLKNNPQEAAAKPRYKKLAALCAGEATYADQEACWIDNADADLLYVFNHIDPNRRPLLVRNGTPPNSQPVAAPPKWRERAAHFIGENRQIICDAAAVNCSQVSEPWTFLRIQGQPWDDVQVANPPRLFAR
jgi:hypothetical protein